MKQRIITAIFFLAVMALILVPGMWIPGITFILFPVLAWSMSYELNLIGEKSVAAIKLIRYLAASAFIPGAVVLIFRFNTEQRFLLREPYMWWTLALFMILLIAQLFVPLLKRGPEVFNTVVKEVAGTVYIFFPLLLGATLLLTVRHGIYWLYLAIVTPWISDTLAYFTGVAFGKRKLIPRLSPNKTVAGFLGGSISTAILYGVLALLAKQPLQLEARKVVLFAVFALIGFVIGIISQFGDWTASALKRSAGIKDFSRLLPGHGGILDRFDSFLFTVPAVFVLAVTLHF